MKTSRPSTKLSEQKKKDIEQARNDVKAGKMTMYGAAKKYNITFPTLWKWCKRMDVDVGVRSSARPTMLSWFTFRKQIKKFDSGSSSNWYSNILTNELPEIILMKCLMNNQICF